MGVLMIKCPATGGPIATGLQTDRSSFARTAVFFSRTLCPYCRTQHEWFAKDAWVEERREAPRFEAA